jgi:hypothetical protein
VQQLENDIFNQINSLKTELDKDGLTLDDFEQIQKSLQVNEFKLRTFYDKNIENITRAQFGLDEMNKLKNEFFNVPELNFQEVPKPEEKVKEKEPNKEGELNLQGIKSEGPKAGNIAQTEVDDDDEIMIEQAVERFKAQQEKEKAQGGGNNSRNI